MLELNRINHHREKNPMFGKFKHNFTFEELDRLYTLERKTLSEIADLYSVSKVTVLSHLNRFNIKTRKGGFKIASDITRERMVKSHRGKKQSIEWRRKRGEALKGENHPQYRHGLTAVKRSEKQIIRKSFEYKIWRESVFQRDNFTCQGCGTIGGYLEAHHIKSYDKYPELRFEISNGQTLCKKCHKEISKIQMRGNTNYAKRSGCLA